MRFSQGVFGVCLAVAFPLFCFSQTVIVQQALTPHVGGVQTTNPALFDAGDELMSDISLRVDNPTDDDIYVKVVGSFLIGEEPIENTGVGSQLTRVAPNTGITWTADQLRVEYTTPAIDPEKEYKVRFKLIIRSSDDEETEDNILSESQYENRYILRGRR